MVTRITDLRAGEGGYAALDDRMLVLDFQAGDPEAFVEIHRRYGGLARHVCRRLLRNEHDAEEAFQETMIRVFQGLYRFNGRYALQPWVARIARNVSLDILRGRSRRPAQDERSLDEHDWEDPEAGPEEALERLVQRDLVLSVLADMPETHRRALVLRELEGRGHREIAEALGITPKQAKSLIHRAKGTFRRGWMRAVAERGLMGIALGPLMLAMRVFGGARRIVDRAAHAAGVTEVAAGSASTAPAVTLSAERMVAAATAAVLIAGGVTVGAATLRHRGAERTAAPAAAAAQPSPVATGPAEADIGPDEQGPMRRHPAGKPAGGRQPAVRDTPPPVVVAPSEEPEATSSPSAEPSPSPSPTPPPVPPAAWNFSFMVGIPSVEPCSCDPTPELVSSEVEGAPGEELTFAQTIKGAAYDVQGDPTWPFYLELSGVAGPAGGHLEHRFVLSSVAGAYWYEGVAVQAGSEFGPDGSVTYTFAGAYLLVGDELPPAGIPRNGVLSASISVWPDGTIFLGSFALTEAAG